MNPRAEALRQRTKRFALDVLSMVRSLPAGDVARVIGQQLLRAGTGVGANYRACCQARSHRDFVSKLGIALEEVDEAAFWIELVIDSKLARGNEWSEALEEANQLSAILAQSKLTALRRANERPTSRT